MELFLDIETFAGDRPEFKFETSSLVVPKTYDTDKKRTPWILKQAKDAELKHEKDYRKQAVVSHKAQLLCIGYALGDQEPGVFKGDEESILKFFNEWLHDQVHKAYDYIIVGHNIKDFDLKFIYHRACKYNCDFIKRWLPKGKYSDRIFDTMEKFNPYGRMEHISLDTIAQYFSVGGKGDINGASVHQMVLDGKMDEIYEYCKDDVSLTREVYNKLA